MFAARIGNLPRPHVFMPCSPVATVRANARSQTQAGSAPRSRVEHLPSLPCQRGSFPGGV